MLVGDHRARAITLQDPTARTESVADEASLVSQDHRASQDHEVLKVTRVMSRRRFLVVFPAETVRVSLLLVVTSLRHIFLVSTYK